MPQYTSVRLYPSTEPDDAFEPWISGGAGFTIGIDDRTAGASGGLFGNGSSGMQMVPGIGLKGGVGVEWRFSKTFGVLGRARYQYIRFFPIWVARAHISDWELKPV